MRQESPIALAQVADYFKALSEVSRLQILNCLRAGPHNVSEIVMLTGLSQANVSKHLKGLMQAGIVSRKPEGVSVFYQISDPFLFELCERVCDRLAVRLQEQTRQLQQFKSLQQR